MGQHGNEILVLRREAFAAAKPFLPWHEASSLVERQPITWVARSEAERSDVWVQPIPCTLVRDERDRYCAFERIEQTRADLSSQISVVIGGHVDRVDGVESISLLLTQTLVRELYEEIGVTELTGLTPIGLMTDWVSVQRSRHIGFVYEVTIEGAVAVRASEEFSLASRITGRFFPAIELGRFCGSFDPWSQLLYQNHIA